MDPPTINGDALSKDLLATSEKEIPESSAESVKKSSKPLRSTDSVITMTPGSISTAKMKGEGAMASSPHSKVTKSTASKVSTNSKGGVVKRRTSIDGALEKQPLPTAEQADNETPSTIEKGVHQAVSVPSYLALTQSRRASLPSSIAKTLDSANPSRPKKPSPASSSNKSLSVSSKSNASKPGSAQRPSTKASLSVSTTKKAPSSSSDSTAGSNVRRPISKVSSPSSRSPSVSSSSKFGSITTSADRGSPLSGRRKTSTPDSRESRFMMLPQVEIKAGDDVRLDLRGHKVRSLKASGLNLSQSLEFVYLRDNLLSSLEGVEILKCVKVLDLSFNDFKGPGFEPLANCKFLQQLYLAGNQITSLSSLPQLPNLEFLSVAQNKLKSLSMASQPRLQVLAASKNKISTLQDFPILPALEHLRVEENPILKMSHLEAAAILLVGPTLKKFNDRDLSHSEQELAKRYPSHTPLCLRDGWEFCRPELSAESTFRFLVDKWKDHLPLGYTLKEASVDRPFEEDICRCHFIFVKDEVKDNNSELLLRYQWYIAEKTPANFLPLDNVIGEVYMPKKGDVGKFLKVECTPTFVGTEYPSIFAITSPISPGTGRPKIISLEVNGEVVEGNVVKGSAQVAWCGGTPGKGVASWLRRRWNSSPELIPGAEYEEYRLTLDDIDSSLVFMYTPVTEEGTKGEPQYAMTDFVKAAPPSVSKARIIGDLVEGNIVKGLGDYFGGKEGPSKFEWSREDKETGEFVWAMSGAAEYVLSKDDVGKRLAFAYIPINFEGQEGESRSFVSEVVKPAPPKVTDLKIIGDVREGNKVTVAAVVTGGTEGASKVQWFKTKSSKFADEIDLEALSTSKIAKAYRLPLSAVGFYIVAKFTPMSSNGESGMPAYAVSGKTVEMLPPSLNFLSITGDHCEGEILTASYGYIGGHEGKSLYNWFLHEVMEGDAGIPITEAEGLLQYCITKDAVGKFISFKCTPVRYDEAIGETRTCMGPERVRPGSPRLLSLEIFGKEVEGSVLHVEKKYWGGEEGNSIFCWVVTSPDGIQTEIKGATSASYTPSKSDIGCLISVSCEPIRNDWARGPTVLSKQVGPILPGPPTCKSIDFVGSMVEGERLGFTIVYSGGEQGKCVHEWFRVRNNGAKDKLSGSEYLDLTLEHVGRRIELVYTPVRDDGLRGKPISIVSDIIAPADPVGLELILPDCSQDKIVVPQKSYYGGQEGVGAFTWYRTCEKLLEDDIRDISDAFEDVVVVGNSSTYTPSLEDVGAYLALRWVPTRKDGICGSPLVAISNNPVDPAPPVVSNAKVLESSTGVYHGTGDYYGGLEGASLFSWYRETSDGIISLIDGANSITYEVTDDDYNCRLLFGYTPIRSDSVVGELRLSKPTDIILPEIPRIQMLILTGKAIERETITTVEVIPDTESQHRVWEKYKKEITYQWYSSSENGDFFEPLPSQRSSSYKLRLEDIGRCLKCECVVADVFGRLSEPAFVVTDSISPGLPKIDKLEIEGRGFHTNLYAVRGVYSGGREGQSKIQWLRSMVGSPDLISIPGEIGRMYESNVDDVGYRLVAVYTPVREDGVEGQPISASTEPIGVEPDVHKEVKQKLELGAVKFEALCDRDRALKKAPVVASFERRILEVNRKRVKVVKPGSKTSFPTTEIRGSYAPPFHVEIFRNDQHRLKIVVDSENELELMVQTRHMRDVIVLVIRGLAQRFNSTSLNSLLKIEN